jgi:ketosteroid isomerase-like protein
MSEQGPNIALAREGFDAFARGDLEAILEFVDPEVEVFVPIELPGAGTQHGHEGFLRWMAEWLEAWEEFEIEPREFEPVGARHVVVPIHQRGRGRGSGIEVETDLAYMFEIVDGHARRVHLYPSAEDALAAARAGEAPE